MINSNYTKGDRVWFTKDGAVWSGIYQSSFRFLEDPNIHIVATSHNGIPELQYIESERLFSNFTLARDSLGGTLDLESDAYPC